MPLHTLQTPLGDYEEQYQLLMESVTDYSIILFDPRGRVATWNAGAKRMFGYSDREAVGMPAHRLFTPEDIEQGVPEQELHAARKEGRSSDDRWHLKKDGSRFWVNGTVTALRDEEGQLRGFAKVCRDLTEQKQAAEETQRLLALLDLSHAMVRERDGRITFWTRGMQELYGWSQQEAVGRFTHELLRTQAPQPLSEIEAALSRDGHWEGELTHTRRDGTEVVVASHWVLHPDPQGGPATVLEVNNDITGLRASQEALHKLETGLHRLAESGVIGISRGDVSGRISDANNAFLQMVGCSLEEVRAGKVRWDDLTPAEFRHLDERAVAELRARGRCTPFEKELVGRGGRVPVLLGIASLNGSDETIAFVLDIAKQKRLEGELRRRAEQLSEADRKKDEFLALLGHELRNPLAPLRSSLQILKMSEVDAATARQARDVMERQVRHLVRLVDDLLDVSRITRGKVQLRKERVELARVVAHAVETCGPLVSARGHKLDVSLSSEPVLLEADPMRLAQVVGNLLTNAARYTPEGGHIRLTTERAGSEVVLRVIDNGVGIRPDFLPRVFDLFVQAESAEHGHGGLGLGLTLVKGLVEMHGGNVTGHSEGPGRGSEFVVRLPLAEQAPGEAAVDAPTGKAAPAVRRVLVVDDNVDAAESLALLLQMEGHQVQTVFHGADVLEAAAAFQPDVVLLDISLPGGPNGYDLAPQLRKLPTLKGTLLVAVTGHGQEEDKRRANLAGFDAHLTKPAEPSELHALLAQGRAMA